MRFTSSRVTVERIQNKTASADCFLTGNSHECDDIMLVVDGMRQEHLELNRDRIQIVRSQLREFTETLHEPTREVSRVDLQQRASKQSLEIEIIGEKLSGVENFLSLLQPEEACRRTLG